MTEFIKLDQLASNYAWDDFKGFRNTWAEKRLKRKHVSFQVDWTGVVEEQSEPKYASKALSAVPKEHILFKTSFTNDTDSSHDYSVNIDRSTVSTCEVELETGYVKGGEVGLTLKVPGDVAEFSAGYKWEYSVNQANRTTHEETLSWGVETNVRVQPHHRANVEAFVSEKQFTGDFVVDTKLSGIVVINMLDRRKDDQFVRVTRVPVVDLFRFPPTQCSFVKVLDDAIIIHTKAKNKFQFGSEQSLRVTEEKLS